MSEAQPVQWREWPNWSISRNIINLRTERDSSTIYLMNCDVHVRVEVRAVAENVLLSIAAHRTAHCGPAASPSVPEVWVEAGIFWETGDCLAWVTSHHRLSEAQLHHPVSHVAVHPHHHAVQGPGGPLQGSVRGETVSDDGQTKVSPAVSLVVMGVRPV